tara:strand:+ start:342 stop:1079 length:738 start_codon:yes stop_codon:yes gene_type:complete
MKFLKIILLFLLLISPCNANTIYNLIKIPNLSIYQSKTSNGLKYLNTLKPFQVGIRNDNVTCFESSIKNIDKKFNLINENFKKYSSDFLKKINLKYIVICEDLSVSGIGAAGVPNIKVKTLIIDLNFNEKFFERIIHHEIFHMINDSYKMYFLEDEWKDLNQKGFKYAKCSTCTDKINLEAIKKTEGFFTEYSMTTASEDMAEVFSFIMKNGEYLEHKSLNDPILKNKISFIKKNVLKIDNNFNF